jgi:N-glycosylase/DNA lyase
MIELHFNEDFNLHKTFECGQIFRFQTFDRGMTYYVPLSDRILKLHQISPATIQIDSNIFDNLEEIVKDFLRYNDDYSDMIQAIQIDQLMKKVVSFGYGLRLLRQNQFECCISYLLSQCSNIPRIKHHLNQLSSIYGQKIDYDGYTFDLFPSRENLMHNSLESYIELKFGYRSKYIYNFIQTYPQFIEEPLSDSRNYNQKLQCIEGIGPKVADCIQLFSCGDLTNFPVDVWMKKFMIKFYNNGLKASIKKIRQIGQDLFGSWAGYAQELIFFYAREHNIQI